MISKVELSQARSQYEVAAAAIPALQQQIAQQENALSLLVGRNPGPIARDRILLELGTPLVPAGLPSAILTQRPDVVSAEQSLIAAKARVSAARALYFPSMSSTGYLRETEYRVFHDEVSMNIVEQDGRFFKGQVSIVMNGTVVTKDFAGILSRDGKTFETVEYPADSVTG